MIDIFAKERRPTALILADNSHVGNEVLQRLGPDNWLSIVSSFEQTNDHLALRTFDVVVIVSKRSELQVLRFVKHIRNQPTRTRVATVLVVSDEISSELANLAGIDRVVALDTGAKDIVLHIAKAATRRIEISRLERTKNYVS